MFEELELEGIHPFKPRKVYVSNSDHTETFVSIDDTIDLKIQALRNIRAR